MKSQSTRRPGGHRSGRHGTRRAPGVGERSGAGRPVGTTVEVHDLFYNTPARRKFMRTERTEFNHIEKWIRRLALARPDVAFIVSHNRRVVLKLSAASNDDERLQRLAAVLGEPFADAAIFVDREAEEIALSGWLALPAR